VVVVVEALPVAAELFQAVRVDILEPWSSHVSLMPRAYSSGPRNGCPPKPDPSQGMERYVHAPRASGNPPALLQALELASARILRLALHKVVIVVLAARADEVGSRKKGGRRRADLLDLGDRVGEGGGVVEHLLVEAGGNVNSSAMEPGMDPLRAPGGPIPPIRPASRFGYVHGLSGCHGGGGGRPVVAAIRGLDCVVWSFKLALL
jgi:hypothetical protein